jgi:hypothetical protein
VEELFAKFSKHIVIPNRFSDEESVFACRADDAGERLLRKHLVIPNRFSGEESALGVEKADSSDLKVFGMTYSFRT